MKARKSKPPYKIPSMADLAKVRARSGAVVVSTFSGAGGSSLGYRLAGARVVWANEFVRQARYTYRSNCDPSTVVDARDIREITGAEIESAIGMSGRDISILDGSPPCAAFSTSGKRDRAWGEVRKYSDTHQRVDDLFDEYARILRELEPQAFIAENVTGLIKGKAIGVYQEIMQSLKNAGYNVKARVIDASRVGVPQARSRVIFAGIRADLGIAPSAPVPLKFKYTTKDVLPHIQWVKCGGRPENWRRASARPHPTITQTLTSPTAYLSGGEWVSEGKRSSSRRLTIDELKIIMSFPADFVLTGTFAQQWERLARSVPPLMMKAIASTLLDDIERAKQ